MLQEEYKPSEGTFRAFPKLYRLTRQCLITEKLDGTNAQVYVSDDLETIKAGSRHRWITVGEDNHGFAKWVDANKDELRKLGPGRHFGEWWGAGIQRTYGLKEKRFSLFNVARWKDSRPDCCHVVPVLAEIDRLDWNSVNDTLQSLLKNGSVAAPGYNNPEGVVVYHTQSNHLFKMTNKDEHKG